MRGGSEVRRLAPVAIILLSGCASYVIQRPDVPSPVAPPATINADFDRAWAASLGWFAEHNLAPKVVDKNSGVIVVETGAVPNYQPLPDGVPLKGSRYTATLKYADCGARNGVAYEITGATYNVLVGASGKSATVQANVKYTQNGEGVGNSFFTCQSTGKWESELQAYVKSHAERK